MTTNHSKIAKKGWETRRRNQIKNKLAQKFNYPKGQVVIFSPMKRLVRFQNDVKELAFPYTVVWTHTSMNPGFIGIGFSNSPITQQELEENKIELYNAPFFNAGYGGLVCVDEWHRKISSVEQGVTHFMHNTNFAGSNYLSNTSIRTYERWERLTKEAGNDLSFIIKTDWYSRMQFFHHRPWENP